MKTFDIFLIFAQNINCVNEAVLTSTHNLCFEKKIRPEDQWSCKRSPDYFPGINTTVKREKGAT